MKNLKENDSFGISIIVPAYNDEEYIGSCLDSLICQTMKEIEIIVVDDCSSDSTPDIVRAYAQKDPRVKAFFLPENSSSFVARKVGVLHSSGKYIMFADADDYLDTSACEILYHKMEEKNVDILHFGTRVIHEGVKTDEEIQRYTNHLNSVPKRLYGKEIFLDFVERKYEGHLWNKIFRQKLCKDVLNKTEDQILPKAQDKYFYWMLAFTAGSYECIPDLVLYHYRYGAGVEGNQSTIPLQAFSQFCTQAWTENAIGSFMKDKNPEGEYDDVINGSRLELISHSVKNWLRLQDEDKAAGLDMMLQHWNSDLDRAKVLSSISGHFWGDDPDKLIRLISGAESMKLSRKEIRTIGTYYHRYDNGGIQRVLSILMKQWVEMGYRVVLFTDYDETPNDYELPEGVTRVKLAFPASQSSNSKVYRPRCISFAQNILDYHIDCMVYHNYFAKPLMWDNLVCKLYNVPFFLFYHNTFSRFLIYNDERFATIPQKAPLFDGMVVLSREDEAYWRNFSRNVRYIANPLTFQLPKDRRLSERSNQILWLGRMADEHKQPYDAITMMQELVKLCPDAELLMVGDNDDPDYLPKMQAHIDEMGLTDHIRLCGFQLDVEAYFRQASVFILTSAFEGFSMVLGEAMSFGLPVVMYDLPYLELVKGNKGVITVENRDCSGMAREVAKLLLNEDLRSEKAAAAYDFIHEMYDHLDLGSAWNKLFQGVQYDNSSFINEDKTNLFRLIINAYDLGMQFKAKRDEEFRKKFPPISLSAELSAETIMRGESVAVTFSSEGGVGEKQYEVRYKQSAKKKWTVVQEFADNTSVSIKPSWIGSYDVRVKAKDVVGTTEQLDLTINVKDVLKNTSTVSKKSLMRGEILTVNASAKGGEGDYSYAVLLKRPSDSRWLILSHFSDTDTVNVTPRYVGVYTLCVKVKDEKGTIVKKDFTVNVIER